MDFNQSLFSFIFQFAHKNSMLDALGVFLAQYLPYLLVLSVLILIFRKPAWRLRIFFFCEMALSIILSRGLITEVIRFIYPNPRPFVAWHLSPLVVDTASSFPSGHAAFYFAMAATLIFYERYWSVWYFIFAAVIGLARIFAGVHWPLDIAGGAVVGILSALFVHFLVRSYFKKIINADLGRSEIGTKTKADFRRI